MAQRLRSTCWARVTSADISPRQLHNARLIADANGWDIEFICADSMTLEGIPDGAFDLVYTSNGVHTWIWDLSAMYRSFARVLRPGGRYIMFDTHPFNRPFDDSTAEIRLCRDYDDTADNNWRVMDIFNALSEQGFDVQRIEEFHAERGAHDLWFYRTLEEARQDGERMFDASYNPWARLPAWLGLSAQKRI
ncbi:MAG TPA: class I SAM-dependent methyltransferase [Candidatus Fimadaptatus faecigallinarum]|uniref:Class I SAM-dependent methyltransferase n=1 Tax=Candidatus Fimadaptatus faecigallinarum TaxID=2840814 RepID=A0A9D1LRX8_9FIRM|nr:class I SAM-dependent methyltransferase [Candidatus Fimadaptatus faecigallinarum]